MRYLLMTILLCFATSGVAAPEIKVEGLFANAAVLVIDGKRRLVKAGNTTPEGVRVVSANSKQAVLEVNGVEGIYALGRTISGNYSQAKGGAKVTIAPSSNGSYLISGFINDRSVRFLVDTGATQVAMNSTLARQLGINYFLDGTVGVAATASGTAKVYAVNLKTVRVGDIELRNVDGMVIDGPHPEQVLLGTSFLNRVDMVREESALILREK